ncbi:hypothetical protein H4R33_007072 [Dimargaris cristalligena]|nr:hypothetical protein H4R33_007072 [Dimargaris cristalligena]
MKSYLVPVTLLSLVLVCSVTSRPQPVDSSKEIDGQIRHNAVDTSSQIKGPQANTAGSLASLPAELFYTVLGHLPADDRFYVSMVNSRYHVMTNQDRDTQELLQVSLLISSQK